MHRGVAMAAKISLGSLAALAALASAGTFPSGTTIQLYTCDPTSIRQL